MQEDVSIHEDDSVEADGPVLLPLKGQPAADNGFGFVRSFQIGACWITIKVAPNRLVLILESRPSVASRAA